ncbi:uncharacterized protein V6R79_005209 [Siganus canaliculatus]
MNVTISVTTDIQRQLSSLGTDERYIHLKACNWYNNKWLELCHVLLYKTCCCCTATARETKHPDKITVNRFHFGLWKMSSQIMFLLLLLSISGSVTSQSASGIFYPADGTSTPLELDGSSPLIPLQRPFVYFGKTYEQIFVNNNGHLTFDEASNQFFPDPIPGFGSRDIIAALWTDFDVTNGGQITYNQYTSGSVLQQATQDINAHFPGLDFTAEFVFVATWTDVPYIIFASTQSTFQAVLISGGQSSFLLLNYGSIASNFFNSQAGYDTMNSIHFFSLPGSFSANATGPNSAFSLGSNVDVPGRWAFLVSHVLRDCPIAPTDAPHQAYGGSYFQQSHGNKRRRRSVRADNLQITME